MRKPIEMLRIAFLVGGGAVLLQVPLFFVLFKFSDLRSRCDTVLSLTEEQRVCNQSQVMMEATAAFLQRSETLLPPQQTTELSNFRPLSNPFYSFVLFSAYRQTMESFHVLGITSVVARKYENERPVYRCEWHPYNESGAVEETENPLTTDAEMLYVRFDENGMTFVPAIVNCTFNRSVGADGKGGVLRLQVGRGPRHWGPNYAVEDVFEEKPGDSNLETIRQAKQSPSAVKLPHKYAFCGPPMYGTFLTEWIQSWLVYHHYIWEGKAHFYFYDVGGINDEGREMLEPWIKAGLLTIVHGGNGEVFPVWYHNQLMFINDCLHRTKLRANWAFFHDFDELLYIPEPNSIQSLLEMNKDVPWVTFANLPGSKGHCREKQSPDQWKIERLMWHNKEPECKHADEDPWLCVAAPGRRKYAVNPRQVTVSGVHRVAIPAEGGINFNGKVGRVHHYHGALNPTQHMCGIPINMTKFPDPNSPPESVRRYDYDDSIANMIPKAREFAGPLLRTGTWSAQQ